MTKIGIAGATGYTGMELVRLLLGHPSAEITQLTSETHQGKNIAEVVPSLAGHLDCELVPLTSLKKSGLDIVFLALPHTEAMAVAPGHLAGGARVIDLSADHRLKDAALYREWYQVEHVNPGALEEAVYGLPEIYREAIRPARLVANPGCYPTSVILAVLPLLKNGWVNAETLIADCKSGVTGAGRKLTLGTHYPECNEGVAAYNLGRHRHTPEIEQEISAALGQKVQVTFSPHLMPMSRGMLATVYASLVADKTAEELTRHYREYYSKEPFVRVLDAGRSASTKNVTGSNHCDIGLTVDRGRVIITSAIDNLVKGASGQAVHNMNLMLGIEETTALGAPGMYP